MLIFSRIIAQRGVLTTVALNATSAHRKMTPLLCSTLKIKPVDKLSLVMSPGINVYNTCA